MCANYISQQHAMSNPRVYEKSFNESWAYGNVIRDELKAASYDIQPFPGTFKSGRDRWMATFMSADHKVVARRIGMRLTSKQSGAPYHVFSRQEYVDRDAMPRTVLTRQQTGSDADASALLNEIYAEA